MSATKPTATDAHHEQRGVTHWFDETYRTKGFSYLRSADAYPIYLQLLEAERGRSLLDVACGPGLLLRAATERGVRATGADVSASALELARDYVPAAELREANAEELPFADGTFDYVTCIGGIERFLDRGGALAEMRRVARDDARFCYMVRNARTLAWRVWREALGRRNAAGHQDALDLDTWTAQFAAAGYRVERVLVDQWARQRLRRALRLGRRHRFPAPEPIARPVLPLRFANEFIFLMRKGGSANA